MAFANMIEDLDFEKENNQKRMAKGWSLVISRKRKLFLLYQPGHWRVIIRSLFSGRENFPSIKALIFPKGHIYDGWQNSFSITPLQNPTFTKIYNAKGENFPPTVSLYKKGKVKFVKTNQWKSKLGILSASKCESTNFTVKNSYLRALNFGLKFGQLGFLNHLKL